MKVGFFFFLKTIPKSAPLLTTGHHVVVPLLESLPILDVKSYIIKTFKDFKISWNTFVF